MFVIVFVVKLYFVSYKVELQQNTSGSGCSDVMIGRPQKHDWLSVFLCPTESRRPREKAGSPPFPFWRHVKEQRCATGTPDPWPPSSSRHSVWPTLISGANKLILMCPKAFLFFFFISFSVNESDVKYLCSIWFIHSGVRSTSWRGALWRFKAAASRDGLNRDLCLHVTPHLLVAMVFI